MGSIQKGNILYEGGDVLIGKLQQFFMKLE